MKVLPRQYTTPASVRAYDVEREHLRGLMYTVKATLYLSTGQQLRVETSCAFERGDQFYPSDRKSAIRQIIGRLDGLTLQQGA